MTVKEVELDAIYNNPFQKRQNYNNIEDLARTIAIDGLQQIPKARPRLTDDGVQLKFGHRRTAAFRWLKNHWKAAKLPDRYNGYTVMPLDIEELTDEEMYRGATIENSQRSELSPIERMEEMKGWVAFGYTSKQIAELYPGMSDATVRGLLYFDQLIPEAKDALHKGEITQGAARALLSMSKVADKKDIVSTLDRIKRNDGQTLNAEEVVEEEFGSLDHVVDMWEDRRDGKPRSHWSNGWLLDMKNFPNKMLPAMTVEDFEKVFQLTEKHQRVWNCITTAKDAAALVGMWESSDFEDDHPRAKTLAHLLNPPACTACPFYTKIRGTHYCGMRVCFERKTIAWHREMIRAASKNLGISIYDETDGPYLVLESYETAHKTLFEKRHNDLRLIAKELITARGYFSQYSFKGVEDSVFMVVVIGETATKLATAKRGGKGTAVDRTAQRRAKLFTAKRKELAWEFTLSAKAMFENVPGEICLRLNDWKYMGVDFRPPEELDRNASDTEQDDYQRRVLVWRLTDDNMDWGEYESLGETADALNDLAKEWGLKMPATLKKRAVQMDAEIETAFPVSTETPKKGKKK